MGSDVAIVGGGVIGLACARELARRGHQVHVIDPDPGRGGAAWVAAGMLAPVTEAQFGESALTAVLLDGARRWASFAADLEEQSGLEVGYDASGTLVVAFDASDRAGLDDLLAYQHSLGLVAHRRSPSECRSLVPSLSPALRGGIEVPGDHRVDNRALLAALLAAGRTAGVRFVRRAARAVLPGPGVLLDDGSRLGSETVVVAPGAGVGAIEGLAGAGLPPVRPVKGHIVRLGTAGSRVAGGAPLLDRTVRAVVRGRPVYLVPRRDGSLVVGATVEERGADHAVRAGAVHDLLCDARTVVPGIDELELLESAVGMRPATPDNSPCIGWTGLDGVLAAIGHFRHGILLTPLTAATVADLVSHRPLPPVLAALAPGSTT